MSTVNGKPVCDMVDGCTGHVTHIDEKGFVYCAPHGVRRKQYLKCRKLEPFEMRFIHAGQTLRSYDPKRNRPSCDKCGAILQAHWLKDGVCNACRNPHLVVTALAPGGAS